MMIIQTQKWMPRSSTMLIIAVGEKGLKIGLHMESRSNGS